MARSRAKRNHPDQLHGGTSPKKTPHKSRGENSPWIVFTDPIEMGRFAEDLLHLCEILGKVGAVVRVSVQLPEGTEVREE